MARCKPNLLSDLIVMQALSLRHHTQITQRSLPMLDEKKTSEVIETSLIYLLSAAVAVGAFVLVGLIAVLLGLSQA